jgi:type IV secretory pathway VirD2 relaxase
MAHGWRSQALCRELVEEIECDLERRPDWVTADNHNTGHPNTNIIIRGITDDSNALNVA